MYDAADIKASDDNGSMSNVRRYVHYMTNSAVIVSTPTTLDVSLNPGGMDTWPVNGLPVPDNNQYRILAVVGCPSSRGNATVNKGYTSHLAMLLRGQYLFDIDRNGLPFLGDVAVVANAETYKPIASVIGPCTATITYPPFILPQPLVFKKGDTLLTQVVTIGALAAGIGIAGLDVAYVMERNYAAA